MDQTLTAVQHESRLRLAPVAECGRPLLDPSQVEQLLAGLDHGAIHVPDRDRGYLPRRHRDHRLVEARHALGRLSSVDQATAFPTLARVTSSRARKRSPILLAWLNASYPAPASPSKMLRKAAQ